jgi:hypothetical protein
MSGVNKKAFESSLVANHRQRSTITCPEDTKINFFFLFVLVNSEHEFLIYTDTSLFINTGHLKEPCVCGPRIESSLSSGHNVYLDKPCITIKAFLLP